MTDTDSSSTSRFDRGFAMLAQIGGSDPRRVLDSMADIAPDLARLTIEFGYADIYGRPGLTLRQRQIANVASLTALGYAAPQLRFHIDGALEVGVSPAEIVEVIMHMSVYAGFPAALNGLAVAKAAFADRPEAGNPVGESAVRPNESAQERYERGSGLIERIFGERGTRSIASLDGIAPDLGRYIAEFAYGDVWSRPGLDLQTREFATVAALTTLGTAAAELRIHLHGFLQVGGTRQEAVEVIIQMAGYAGFPAALNGMAAARDVFSERDAAERSDS
ncbi:carboxymuconolactone decarboxylase family protein [Nocardia alni]|uniref:carboxymuconolactone decarboxylase family protein n=1 Tax=Nocardia alni TaxID=2815723 RepID=UPI0027E00733|nr:carboxymuconolactone decarboxylase family protein [Nocardia alni]